MLALFFGEFRTRPIAMSLEKTQAHQSRKLSKQQFILVSVAFATTITAAPIYTVMSTHLALENQSRSCNTGTIRRIQYNSPHIIATTSTGETSLTLPSDPLSFKKRITRHQYPLEEGDAIAWCGIDYGLFSQEYVTLLKKGDATILSEVQAIEIIRNETGLWSLLALNALSYLALYAAYQSRGTRMV